MRGTTQLELGIRYEEGHGVGRDLDRATRLYRLAAADSGGAIHVYSPPVGQSGRGRVIPVPHGQSAAGLAEARAPRKDSTVMKPNFKGKQPHRLSSMFQVPLFLVVLGCSTQPSVQENDRDSPRNDPREIYAESNVLRTCIDAVERAYNVNGVLFISTDGLQVFRVSESGENAELELGPNREEVYSLLARNGAPTHVELSVSFDGWRIRPENCRDAPMVTYFVDHIQYRPAN